jgi:Glyoxalase-like domain
MHLPGAKIEADRQLPLAGEIFLDHVGHFVRDPLAASSALERAGFAPTPVSVQADDTRQPTGTGNVTAMLKRGYIEVLFKTADTALGREFERALAQRAGVHLVALSVANATRAHARLASAGFRMRPLVEFSRQVETQTGPGIAAFSVARVERGEMTEGRIQILTHRTEDSVWQKRWLTHPNGATGLLDVTIAVADVWEATARFARFADRQITPARFGRAVLLDRGAIQFVIAQAFAELLPEASVPGVPFIGAYGVKVESLEGAGVALRRGGISVRQIGRALAAKFPEELGAGAWVFVEQAADLPWRV